jgi:hypothetical protein
MSETTGADPCGCNISCFALSFDEMMAAWVLLRLFVLLEMCEYGNMGRKNRIFHFFLQCFTASAQYI